MKIIAFYLPQFHEIPENNEWWGEGFTEWKNVKKAKPIYEGHYQPRVPLNENYYNLIDIDTMQWQISLAKKYGIYGFCFYHYWFKDGKKLLEKPVEQYLYNRELDLPFCLSWANEPWSRRWDGSEHIVLMSQEYGEKKEWQDHFNYLLPFFQDKRYIRINNKPLFIIYKPDLISCMDEMLDYWQYLAKENGLDGLCFGYQHPNYHFLKEKDDDKFDLAIEFEPVYSATRAQVYKSKIEKIVDMFIMLKKGIGPFLNRFKQILNSLMDRHISKRITFRFTVTDLRSYDEFVVKSCTNIPLSEKAVPGVFTDWDNTPRRGKNATIYSGSTPKKFREYLSCQIKRANGVYKKDMVFVNAWNEWAESAYLEPDGKYGYSYLEAVREALKENGFNRK